jgi:hypothetical protein
MLKGFISYAHDDHAAFEQMKIHLRAVERQFDLTFWADDRIKPGNYWSIKVAGAIEAAQVHVLMFTPAFIRSDYIFDHELPAINDKCSKGDLVLPVVIDRCAWKAFVGTLQAVPIDRTHRLLPVMEWHPQRHGFDSAREQIAASIAAQFGPAPTGPFSWGTP